MAIFLYVLGLLAVNGYLLKFGVSDFSLVRTKFIYTGALIAASFVIPNALVGQLAYAVAREMPKDQKPWEKYIIIPAVIFSCYSVVFIFGNAFRWMSETGIPSRRPLFAFVPWSPYIAVLILSIIGGLILARLTHDTLSDIQKRPHAPRLVHDAIVLGYATFALTVVGVYVALFMSLVYARIPPQLGGGRPHEVRLLFSEQGAPSAKDIGLQLSPSGRLSNPVVLLYETEQGYVLRISDTRIAVVDKSIAIGMVTQSDN